jgi:hypothetical protein
MAWFKVDDGLHASRKLLSIPKRSRFAAVGLWTVAGSWCADQLTDGLVPEYMLTVWGSPPAAPQSLVEAGLWERISDGYRFCNWLEYQPRKEDVDAERAASRERMRELRAKRKQKKPLEPAENEGVFGRTGANGSENVRNPDPTRPDPTPIEEAKASSVEIREDVQGLCELLATLIEANGSKRPKINKTWTDSARRMVDLDDREPERAANLMRWSQANTFWRKNILSMPTFREKYDQLRLAALEDWEKNKAGASPDGEIDPDAVLGRDVWTPGTPPSGLSVAEEIAWKKQQRAAHQAARIEEAKRKLGVAA